ncbi:GDP-mannose 4,6-dehydratase [Polynucleobacter sp. MWH-Spelu-300-X4]|uniref:GDP-mannose 4,6-dehydratase n=1 Tax=Polynucleobacter sp. MWH-Spelu-300-X4 TaxID=2689109 RepID=UPI001BFE9715|nr:NAD-dependent epimerase/dehydratase family protein [Polynucleobacter sp. MWH-Spelu-300-X4]QWD79874.1 GDP-mannose 4,6-dehydratase [Polynucleobacter sp. MWH-Spelu-300-X4]
MAILLTGGAGYIGSHVLVKLLQARINVVVIDNFSNSNPEVFNRIKAITNQTVNFIHGDIRDAECLKNIFQNFKINSVMHFAGLKSVRESEENPAIYFDNNLIGSKNLLEKMSLANIKSIVFSSSATVYGAPNN